MTMKIILEKMNHSYDGNAEKCFGMQENRNKQK